MTSEPTSRRRPRWRYVISIAITLFLAVLAWFNRAVIAESFALVGTANPWLIAAAMGATLLGYFASSRIFWIGLGQYRQRFHPGSLLLMTLTGIVVSQLVPAGGVGSYAFFISVLKRRGVPTAQAGLLVGLEFISYLVMMIMWGTFSVIYLAAHTLGQQSADTSLWELVVAAVVAALLLGTLTFVATRSEQGLQHIALGIGRRGARLLRRPALDERIHDMVAGFVRERDTLLQNPRRLAAILGAQFVALSSHSLAIWLVLQSLQVHVGFSVPIAAFGTTLILSSFNVLPGGGGTVEAVLVTVLTQFGAGKAAIPAAVLFRLMNYWALIPVAGIASSWLLRAKHVPDAGTQDE